jgi:hypothetical protein
MVSLHRRILQDLSTHFESNNIRTAAPMTIPLRPATSITTALVEPNPDVAHQSLPEDSGVVDGDQSWNGIRLIELVQKYGTPLKLTYVPKIMEHIKHTKTMFAKDMERRNYDTKLTY